LKKFYHELLTVLVSIVFKVKKNGSLGCRLSLTRF